MTPERWHQIEELFNAALDRPVAERAAFLAEVCGDDAELRSALDRLLRSDAEAGDFIEAPPPVSQVTALLERTLTLQELPDHGFQVEGMIGRQIGAYRIERELGRGGMGEVYLAWRADNEFRKQVAIKLVRRGVDNEFVLRRFRHERQILASFDHPNIARLLDGGTTDEGVPYFVMEYIEGQPLTRYCDEQQLPLSARLQLVTQVCAAVQYAHEQQVIHRDIKPGNIMVTREGTAKLLDFGIARILNPELLLDTGEHTLTGTQLMTPEYASPEQMRGEAIIASSDQYSLGVLLYELLTGRRPYQLRHKLLHEVARLICEEIPLRPSTAIQQTEEIYSSIAGQLITLTPQLVSQMRRTSPELLKTDLTRGLDAIVLKTLHKRAEERYASVTELAADINRWLQGQPVAAPPIAAQTTLAPASHHKSIAILPLKPLLIAPAEVGATHNFLGVGLADALITRLGNLRNLTVRPTASVIRYTHIESDAVAAGRELNVTHVLDGRFQQAGERIRVTVQLIEVATAAPQWAAQFDERSTDLLDLQDSLAAQVAEEIVRNLTGEERAQLAKRGTDNPEAYEAYLQGRYHWHTYTADGLARAITCFYDAIAIDPQFAAAYTGVADYFNFMGITAVLPPDECFRAAKQSAAKAIELDDKLAEAYVSLAVATWAYDWDFDASRRLMWQAIELNENYAQAYEWLAHFYSSRGQHSEAIKAMKRALRIDPQSPALHTMMAFILHNAGQHAEANRYNQRALELEPDYFLALQAKGWLYPSTGKVEEALDACRKAVELTDRAPLSLWALAHTLAVAGKQAEARGVLNEMLELARRRYIPHYFFARIHTALGEFEQAFEQLDKAFSLRESWVQELPVDPQLDALRADSRFPGLLARLQPRVRGIEEAETVADLTRNTQEQQKASQTRGEPASPEPGGNGLKPGRRTWLILLLALGLICALALFFYLKPRSGRDGLSRTPPATHAIAVVPFRSVTADETEQSLGTGLADALAMRLGQIKQLAVRPVSALQPYALNDTAPQQIAREQQVEYVVSGILQYRGESVSVKAQMFNAATSTILWQAELAFPPAELAKLQTTMAERVLREMKFEVTGDQLLQFNKSYTTNSAAYQLYLVGRYHFSKRSVPALYEAIKYFNRALQQDDRFALAYTGLADCYALLNLYAFPPPPDAYERARENAERAVSLDVQLAQPHASLAYVLFWHDRDRARAEQELRRAFELDYSYATAHHWLALMLTAQGRFAEAKEQIAIAEQLDPRSAIIKSAAAMTRFFAREYDEALNLTRSALELDPGLAAAHKIQRWIYQTTGNYEEALAAYQREKSFGGGADTEWPIILAQVQASGQRPAEAQASIQRALNSVPVRRDPGFLTYEIALAYALTNQPEQAFAWLDKADAARTHGFNYVMVEPGLDRLRADPRYDALLRRAGFKP